MLEVLGQIDGRHAAFAQMAFDLVAVGEGGREPGGDLGHRAKIRAEDYRGERSPHRRYDLAVSMA